MSTAFNRRFSLAHFDRFHGDHAKTFYLLMKNADPRYRANIHDIYFGKYFEYTYRGEKRRAGNPMGLEASDEQIDWLFKLQEETGIEISLTFNTVEVPYEVVFDQEVSRQFVEWVGGFYDRGLRSCTISSEHLMRKGELQERCPEMRWKNTVNQIVADAQQLIDYAYLGYNTILLDRSLNRNIKELRNIRRARDYFNQQKPEKKLLTSLLIAEACVYRCPFKREHDRAGELISLAYFSGPADMTCNGWRGAPNFGETPRSGINLVAHDRSTFQAFAELVDVFKLSGRFTDPATVPAGRASLKGAWFYNPDSKFQAPLVRRTIFADDFNDIIDNNLVPIHAWVPGWIDADTAGPDWRKTYGPYQGIWSTDRGRKLEKTLMNCRNQCWDCHECERVWGGRDVDSALQWQKRTAPAG